MEHTYEELKSCIKKYDRKTVGEILKVGVIKEVPEEERNGVIQQIAGLRDISLIGLLEKDIPKFTAPMFELEMNLRNREFLAQVLNKYYSHFDLESEETADWMMAMACETEDKKVLKNLFRDKKGFDALPFFARVSDETFPLIKKVKASDVDRNVVVELLIETAKKTNGEEYLDFLSRAGFSLTTTTEDGLTADDILERRIASAKGNSKNAKSKLSSDKDALRRIRALTQPAPKAPADKKKTIPLLIAAIVVVVVIIAVVCSQMSDSKSGDSSDASESTISTTLDTDTSLVVADGDTVNIDYVGTIDGEEFDGGSTDGSGTDLTIGSGTYIDDFEDQLIGHNVGETVDVEVTFPDDYSVEDLQGKDAVFETTINGIYE